MRFLVFCILSIGWCRLNSAEYVGRIYRRNVQFDEKIPDSWFNVDEELDDGSHANEDTPNHFTLNLRMEFPKEFTKKQPEEKIAPIVKNPMWIDKLAIIKPPPMCSTFDQKDDANKEIEDYDEIPMNYRIPFSDRDLYHVSKLRQRRSTQQPNKKATRQSEKKSKFKAWLENKMDKKLGEKFAEKFSKLKKSAPSRQARSVDMDNDNVESEVPVETTGQKDNRINRQSKCVACGGLSDSCPHCQHIFVGSLHPPRPQFIEFINGQPMPYMPHHATPMSATPRYVYDQLGHKYLENDGHLRILPPVGLYEGPMVGVPYRAYSPDYAQMLFDTLQRHPHFQTSHRLEDGYLTDSPIKQTQDVIEFIKALTESKNKEKNFEKRHIKEYNSNKDVIDETIVDEDALSNIFLEQDREFEKYLEQIGYSGQVEMFDLQMDKSPASQSIFYSNPKKSNNFQGQSKVKINRLSKPFVNIFKETENVEYET